METGYFNFITKDDPSRVFSTAFTSITFTSLLFFAIAMYFNGDISSMLELQSNPEYVIYLIWVLTFDALTIIPFARLRALNKAFKFALIKLTVIAINIGSNLILLLLFPYLAKSGVDFGYFQQYVSSPNIDLIFLSNFLSSGIGLLMLLPSFKNIEWSFDWELLKRMLSYSWPILIAGTAGIINETMDKQFLLYILPEDIAKGEIGIYGANYKIAIFMTLFIQAFRMGVEPFFFAKAKDHDAKITYSKVMNVFVVLMSLIYLFIMANLEIFKHFIQNEQMWTGLDVVPILLMANFFLGIYINLSVWYKINDKTKYGAMFSIVGALITIVLNIWLIPVLGFRGSAWATLAAYGSMMMLSMIFGQKYYPIPYRFGKMIVYIGVSVLFGSISFVLFNGNLFVGNILLFGFTLLVLIFEWKELKTIFVNN
jgi:O-antigen/teichoic acid export membrane protein